jgi:hypothetical protein
MAVVARFDSALSVTEFTVGAGHDHCPDAFVGVARKDSASARRFVVRVGMHGHQGQWLVHTLQST